VNSPPSTTASAISEWGAPHDPAGPGPARRFAPHGRASRDRARPPQAHSRSGRHPGREPRERTPLTGTKVPGALVARGLQLVRGHLLLEGLALAALTVPSTACGENLTRQP
jgi:hypothetical protein